MRKFKPKPGQVDYTNVRWAPIINCVVLCKDKILLVKRSKNLKFYPGRWNGISGFLDDKRSIEQKVKDELAEEIGIKEKDIISIKVGHVFDLDEPKYKKTWIVHPILVRMRASKCLRANKIKLDWEAKEFKWIRPKEAEKFKLVPGFDRVIRSVL